MELCDIVLKHKGYVTIAVLPLTNKTSFFALHSIVAAQVIVFVCVNSKLQSLKFFSENPKDIPELRK
jgi:hypothetical protein